MSLRLRNLFALFLVIPFLGFVVVFAILNIERFRYSFTSPQVVFFGYKTGKEDAHVKLFSAHGSPLGGLYNELGEKVTDEIVGEIEEGDTVFLSSCFPERTALVVASRLLEKGMKNVVIFFPRSVKSDRLEFKIKLDIKLSKNKRVIKQIKILRFPAARSIPRITFPFEYMKTHWHRISLREVLKRGH